MYRGGREGGRLPDSGTWLVVLWAATRGFLVDLGFEKWKVESGVVDGW